MRSRHLRFLEEAAKLGDLTVLLWPDETIRQQTGKPPKFPLAERLYFLNAVRHVTRVVPLTAPPDIRHAADAGRAQGHRCGWMGRPRPMPRAARFAGSTAWNIACCRGSQMAGFPVPPPMPSTPGRKKVVVTGCYDWFHSGHVRFCEEVSAYGDLYVIVGHDANIRLLKGEGHPLIPRGRAALRRRLDQVRQAGADLQRRGLAGCRPGDPAAQAGHLRGQ